MNKENQRPSGIPIRYLDRAGRATGDGVLEICAAEWEIGAIELVCLAVPVSFQNSSAIQSFG